MHRRLLFPAVPLGLLLIVTPWVAAQDKETKADKPSVVLRLASLDTLRANIRYLGELVGKPELAKQLDALIKSKLGDKGLDGIDEKKPLGAYAWIKPDGADTQVAAMLPIADEKAFLGLLENLELKPEKDGDGVYSFAIEKVPFPIYFRFANNYVYVTARDKEVLAKEKLLSPGKILPTGQIGVVSALLNIDEIPSKIKDLFLSGLDNQLAGAKETEVPGESEAGRKFRDAFFDGFGAAVKSVLQSGGETALRLDVDRATGDLSLSLRVHGQEGSSMAASIKRMGQISSVTAPLIRADSALSGSIYLSMPEELRKLLAPVIEEGKKKATDKVTDQAKRDALSALLTALAPTLKSGTYDAAVDLRGPSENNRYTLAVGIRIEDGLELDKTVRQLVNDLPEKDRKAVTFEVDKVGSIAIHRLKPERDDEFNKKLFGDEPFYFAVRDKVVLATRGEKGLEALKEALTMEPKPGKVLQFTMSVSRFAPLMTKDNKEAPKIAKEVFANHKDSDKIHMTLEGGSALRLRLDIKAQLVTFITKLNESKKEEEK